MSKKLITQPVGEPITLADNVYSHLRLIPEGSPPSHPDDDYIEEDLIPMARQMLEHELNRAFLNQTWELYLDAFPSGLGIEIPIAPLESITSIKYFDTDGVEQTFNSSKYQVDIKDEPARVQPIKGETWPSEQDRYNAVTIKFVAGYGTKDSNTLPIPLKQALYLIIGDLYCHRETVIPGLSIAKIPSYAAIERLTSMYRVYTNFDHVTESNN
jgi:uncharacterized phiE125 gp8 family phage protein